MSTVTRLIERAARDFPAGLDAAETIAYRKGHARATMTYVRKHGTGSVSATYGARVTSEEVRAAGAAYDLEHGEPRQLAAHKAGMASLRKFWTVNGLESRAERYGPVKATRKPRKPAAVPDVVGAAVESGRVAVIHVTEPVTVPAPMPEMTRAARKASNRELAAAMRAAGTPITPETWAAAKSGTLAQVTA